MKNALPLLLLLVASCGESGRSVDEAVLWYHPESEPVLYCPGSYESLLQSDVDPDDPVIVARCAWRCATYEPFGLTEPGSLLLVLYDAAPAPWLPDDLQIFAMQDEHCD